MRKDIVDTVKFLEFMEEKMSDKNIRSVAQFSRIIYGVDEDGKKQYLRNIKNGKVGASLDLVKKTCEVFGLPSDYFTLDVAKGQKPSEIAELKARIKALEDTTERIDKDVQKINKSIADFSMDTLREFMDRVKSLLSRK